MQALSKRSIFLVRTTKRLILAGNARTLNNWQPEIIRRYLAKGRATVSRCQPFFDSARLRPTLSISLRRNHWYRSIFGPWTDRHFIRWVRGGSLATITLAFWVCPILFRVWRSFMFTEDMALVLAIRALFFVPYVQVQISGKAYKVLENDKRSLSHPDRS